MTWMDVVQRVAAATQGGARAAAAGRSAGARSLRIRLGEARSAGDRGPLEISRLRLKLRPPPSYVLT